MRFDRRAIPRTGERVPYLIVYGEPGRPLIQSVRNPTEVIESRNLRPNSQYYITKVIVPPLNRCFSLAGVDVMAWFSELPNRSFRPRLLDEVASPSKGQGQQGQGVIFQYFASHHCAVCDTMSTQPVCEACLESPQETVLTLSEKIREWDKSLNGLRTICRGCTGFPEMESGDACSSLDCPVIFKRKIAQFDAEQIDYVQGLLEKISF